MSSNYDFEKYLASLGAERAPSRLGGPFDRLAAGGATDGSG